MKNTMLVVSVLLFSSLCSALNTPRDGKVTHKRVARLRGEEAGKGALAIYDGMAANKKDAVRKQERKALKAKADAQLNKLHRDSMKKITEHRAAVKIQSTVRSKKARPSRSQTSVKGRAGSSSTVTGDLALDRADTTLSVVE